MRGMHLFLILEGCLLLNQILLMGGRPARGPEASPRNKGSTEYDFMNLLPVHIPEALEVISHTALRQLHFRRNDCYIILLYLTWVGNFPPLSHQFRSIVTNLIRERYCTLQYRISNLDTASWPSGWMPGNMTSISITLANPSQSISSCYLRGYSKVGNDFKLMPISTSR